ncbi:MAG: type II toxin-antitoxin system RelE/ParE family toxin [Desulfobacteraceae bacterium]|jgi:mRNA interferase RelE/StbE|nr:type II toxin-antitoxin system RelE/ParE family toxin [Desulfobacteraceae bacterium]
MKKFGMKFTAESFRILSKFHPENKKLIKKALDEIRKNPYAGGELQEELYGFRSFKLKRYRVLYRVNEEEKNIQIFHVGHRKDVYEQFNRLLNQLKKPSK